MTKNQQALINRMMRGGAEIYLFADPLTKCVRYELRQNNDVEFAITYPHITTVNGLINKNLLKYENGYLVLV